MSSICIIPRPIHRPRDPPRSDKKDGQLNDGIWMLYFVTEGRIIRTMVEEFILLPTDWVLTPVVLVDKQGFLKRFKNQ